jgi:tripartite-type tricarboxylate transporter receptor subunit TctC
VLASTGPKRESEMSDVPTVVEAGIAGYEVTSWNGVFAPKGTPKDVLDSMNKAMHDVLTMPDVKEQFAKIGVEAHPSSPDELMARLKADIVKWNAVVDKAGIPRK